MPHIGKERQGRCPSCNEWTLFIYIGCIDTEDADMGIVHLWNCATCGTTVNPFKNEDKHANAHARK
jgi:DNA-directed RNA polymerase subunit RPC12/RpoP